MTFQDQGGKTLLTFHEIYPSTEAPGEHFEAVRPHCRNSWEQLEELLSGTDK